MISKTRCSALTSLVVIFSLCALHCVTGDVYGAKGEAAHIDSPLNQSNLDEILDNTGKYSDSDVQKMLGPPTLITVESESPGWMKMLWEDVSRIELTVRDGAVVKFTGTFSPHFSSKSINYSTFKKLHTGMTVNDLYKNFFLGFRERTTRDSDNGTTTLIFEQYVRLSVIFKDGKVRSAIRIEFLNR